MNTCSDGGKKLTMHEPAGHRPATIRVEHWKLLTRTACWASPCICLLGIALHMLNAYCHGTPDRELQVSRRPLKRPCNRYFQTTPCASVYLNVYPPWDFGQPETTPLKVHPLKVQTSDDINKRTTCKVTTPGSMAR